MAILEAIIYSPNHNNLDIALQQNNVAGKFQKLDRQGAPITFYRTRCLWGIRMQLLLGSSIYKPIHIQQRNLSDWSNCSTKDSLLQHHSLTITKIYHHNSLSQILLIITIKS